MIGELGVLNVGAGDTKLIFDKNNPQEMARAARIITDMLKRGYAILIEVPDGKGGSTAHRVHKFQEDTCEYIIADFDSAVAAEHDAKETKDAEKSNRTAKKKTGGKKAGRGVVFRPVPATGASGVAIARSAGG